MAAAFERAVRWFETNGYVARPARGGHGGRAGGLKDLIKYNREVADEG